MGGGFWRLRERGVRGAAALGSTSRAPGLPAFGLQVFRADEPVDYRPVVYEPGVIVVGQGRKRARLAGAVHEYDRARIFVVSVPIPIESQIVDASESAPFFALRLPFEMAMVGEIAAQLGGDDEGESS